MATALVTGTSSGFGRATAERLVALGWTVIGTVRDPVTHSAPAGCETLRLDLRDSTSIDALAQEVSRRAGGLDALVSNAGIAVLGPLEELSMEEFRDQIEVNLLGTVELCRAVIPALRASKGVMVQVSSVSGRIGDAGFGAYCASKFGLEGATMSLAGELAAQHVRVVLVEPGPFRTAIGGNMRLAVGRGAAGVYDAVWADVDEFAEYISNDAPDQAIVVAAIVAAVTDANAPGRIPVGSSAFRWLREETERASAELDTAEAYVKSLHAGE